jgi:hypothetical protein
MGIWVSVRLASWRSVFSNLVTVIVLEPTLIAFHDTLRAYMRCLRPTRAHSVIHRHMVHTAEERFFGRFSGYNDLFFAQNLEIRYQH